MKTYTHIVYLLFLFFAFIGCNEKKGPPDEPQIETGAQQMQSYLPLLEGKRIGLTVNHTSKIGDTHLVDTLIRRDISVVAVFGPEHGFRGQAADGEKIADDSTENYRIVSLYGKKRKPSPEDLADIDIMIFDIQDVGTRFYTYISTMHYVMEACAENDVQVIILDRPNPNGSYVDGPLRKEGFESFVGMHAIPVVHGLTVGELAMMINNEGWLTDGVSCDLKVIQNENYSHKDTWNVPDSPSPNLPNNVSIKWYPTLCFFEGTKMSIGRGTYFPFQVIGYPDPSFGSFEFTPVSIEGMSKYPKLENELCYGLDLRQKTPPNKIDVSFIISMYENFDDKESFFIGSFNRLAGTDKFQEQIKNGWDESRIRESWKSDLETYKVMRKKYLLYSDFQ